MNPIDGASNSEIVIKQCDRAYYLFSPRTSSMQKLPKLPFETSNAYSITLSLFSPKQVGREKRKRRRILLEKLGGVEGETVNCKKARCGLSTSDILISGMQRLGVEIAKNLVLAGVKSVTLHDESPVQLWDLSSSLAFSENDVGKNRTLASVQKLQELNTAVAVSTLTTTLTKEQLSDFQAVVFTDISLEKAIEFDNYCRAQQPPIVFIKTEVRGLFGSVFCDFGPEYTVADIDGQEPHSGKIASISNDNPTLVSCDDDERLDFQDGDLVVLSEVKGMAELNDGRSRKVKKASWPHSFQLDEDTSNYGSYERGGIVTQVKQPKALHFKSLKEALSNPGDFLLSDFSKSDRPPVLHLAFQALDKFVSELGRCPAPGSEEDIQELISVADAINDEMGDHKVKIDRKIIRDLALGSRTVLSPMAAMFGGIVGQEVVQALACSGKFHRPFQVRYL
ncbi:E1 ubiquitin-activating enzyme [Ranunculus cassubicifolius]